MIFSLALRNVARNKVNNTIIVLLIGVICFLFFMGNSIIERSNISLHQAFISSITGDVVIQKKGDVTMNLFGANTPVIDDFFVVPVFPFYDDVMEIIGAEDSVRGITSQISGKAYLDIYGYRSPALLSGVDAQSYFPMFPGIKLKEGRLLQSGETGAMITMDRAQKIEQNTGRKLQIGESLLFTAGGTFGFKLREVPLVGIFNYKNPGLFMNEIIILDPQTVRSLNSIQTASSSDIELSEEAEVLLSTDIDDIFNMSSQQQTSSSRDVFSVDFLQSWLAESKQKSDKEENKSGGDWNFIIINLKENINTSSFINSLNSKIASYDVIAVDWRVSAGTSTILLLLLQILFNAGIFLVCIAGIIAAINILLISVFRRTREVGTLRAIGASNIYVGSLLLCENITLSLIAGFVGIISGALFIGWVNSLSYAIPNELIASLLGGNILNLIFIPKIAFLSFILAIVLGIIVSIYPIHTTLKIEPIEAVRQG